MTISDGYSGKLDQSAEGSRIQQVLDKSPGFFLLLKGPDFIVESANKSFLNAFNLAPDIIGRSLPDILPDFKHSDLAKLCSGVFATGLPQAGHIEKRKNNDPNVEVYDNYVCQPVFEAGGGISGILLIASDVTASYQVRRRDEEVRASALRLKQLYEAVTSNTPDLIYVFDLQYRFSYANPALLAMWGKTWNESIGKGLRENGYEEWHAQMHEREIDQIAATKQSIRGEVSFPHATLGRRVYDYLLVPVLNQEGQVEAVAGTTRDISEIKAAEEQLKGNEELLKSLVAKRTSELVRSNEDLQQFAHVASHDLKEPLRKIKLYSSRIRQDMPETTADSITGYVEKIEKSSGRMQAMIDGVLNYSTVSGFDIVPEVVDLNEVLRLVMEDLEILIQTKCAVFDIKPLPAVGGSSILISQLFYNLIANSLKFSRPGVPPVIELVWGKDDEQPESYYRFCLKDNGIGINAEDLEKIFQTFLRLNPKDQFEGTGLGLSLCKKIVERHGGIIRARSIDHNGAIFEFTLPKLTGQSLIQA